MKSVLITLRGPGGEEDLVAPADTSVERLLPTLLEMAELGVNGHSDWELAVPGKPPLAAEATLADQGVVDGSTLQLRRRGEAYGAQEDAEPRADDGLTPLERTRALMPERLDPLRRLGATFESVRRKDDRSLRERARESWRETNYLSRLDLLIESAPLDRTRTIAVASPGGGGGSTLTALLGSLLAHLRGDRVLAVDAADLGGLGSGASRAPGSGIREIALQPSIDGLLALAAPSRLAAPIEVSDEHRADAIHSLQSVTDILVLDCDTEDDAVLAAADQVVLVTDAGSAEGRARARLLKPPLGDAPYVAVINRELRIRPRLDPSGVERRLPDASGLIVVNRDRVLGERLESARFSWTDDPKGTWPRSIRELAVVLAAGWEGR